MPESCVLTESCLAFKSRPADLAAEGGLGVGGVFGGEVFLDRYDRNGDRVLLIREEGLFR